MASVRTSLRIYADGTEKSGLGDVRLSWDTSGAASLTFACKRTAGIGVWDRITATYGSATVFDGRVRSARRSDTSGLLQLQATDWKDWLGEVPFAGRSLQVSRTARHLRVKYAFGIAAVEAGWIVPWTVGALLQDIVNNAYAGLGGTPDTLPLLGDIVPDSVCSLWQHDRTNWTSDIFTTVAAWVSGLGVSTSQWATLAAAGAATPWAQQFDGESVRGCLESVLGKYYPGYGWWYNPATGQLLPYSIYTAAPLVYEASTRRLLLDDVEPMLDGCFTRVIVEGQKASKVAGLPADYVLNAFVGDGPIEPTVVEQDHYKQNTSFVEMYVTTTTRSGVNADNSRVQADTNSTGWMFAYSGTAPAADPPPYTTQAGSYYKDERSRKDTGWGGTAYTLHGMKRTLVVVDEEVGESVYIADPSTGEATTVDRSVERDALASGVWTSLRDVRYSGKLVVPGSPAINPLQRVTVRNHSVYGTITCRPSGIQWDNSTGLLTYTLGDSKYNPIEEIRLRKRIAWRDSEYNAKLARTDKRPIRRLVR